MAFTYLLAALLVLVPAVSPGKSIIEELQTYTEECEKETGFKMDMPKNITSFEEISEKAKCFLACIGQKSGQLTKEGFNLDKIKEDVNKVTETIKQFDKAFNVTSKTLDAEDMLKTVETCAKGLKVKEDNLCEVAHQFMICYFKKIEPSKA